MLAAESQPQVWPWSSTKRQGKQRQCPASHRAPVQSNLAAAFFADRFVYIPKSARNRPIMSQRDVDEKYRAPVKVVNERAADQRAEHRRDRERAGPDTERLGPLLAVGKGYGQDRHGRRDSRQRPRNPG
jgi:hypothetical protein